MEPAITVITLGVDDLDVALRFYRDGLGFPTEGIAGEQFEHGSVAFFQLQAGLRLALWPRASIAQDTGLRLGPASSTDMTIGYNVASRDEVDRVMRWAAAAGARVVKEAHETFWGGYSGYFHDPDGHVWEVVWNPVWSP